MDVSDRTTAATGLAEPQRTMLSVRLDPLLVRNLKLQAVLAGRSLQTVAAEALREWLQRHARQF